MDPPGVRRGDGLSPPEAPTSFEPAEEPFQSVNELEPTGRLRGLGNTAIRVIGYTLSSAGYIFRAANADRKQSEHKIIDTAASVATGGVVAVGLSRLPTAIVPKVTAELLQHTHNALEVGLGTAAAVGIWGFISGETLNQGISRYPTAVETAEEKFPAIIGLFSDSLPGLESSSPNNDETQQRFRASKIGNFLLNHGRRGMTAVAIGIAPYVGAAHIKGESRPAIRKLAAKSALDGGTVIGAISGLVAEGIILVSHDNPGLAHTMQSDLGNTKLWWAAAGSLMAAELANKVRGRRKAAAESRAAALALGQAIPGSDFNEAGGTSDILAGAQLRLQAKLEQELNG